MYLHRTLKRHLNQSIMRNSILITSDLKSLILVDTNQDDQRLAIGKRGVLLSVLGADICATEVPVELDAHVNALIRPIKPFFEFEVKDQAKNQLCITYNDVSNVVFIIGISDIAVSLKAPVEIPKTSVTTFAVGMKDSTNVSLASRMVVLTRLETTGVGVSAKRFIRFYHVTSV
jgi:hypothetical protein